MPRVGSQPRVLHSVEIERLQLLRHLPMPAHVYVAPFLLAYPLAIYIYTARYDDLLGDQAFTFLVRCSLEDSAHGDSCASLCSDRTACRGSALAGLWATVRPRPAFGCVLSRAATRLRGALRDHRAMLFASTTAADVLRRATTSAGPSRCGSSLSGIAARATSYRC